MAGSVLLGCACVPLALAQTVAAPQTVGTIDIAATKERIQVAGAVTLSGDSTLLGNGSTVTAGKITLPIHLTRGGTLDLCATTELHLSQSNGMDADRPLMLALDRGALETHYKIGKSSDVVLTPDLRILLSGPGTADVRIRVNAQGDTCVDNRGKDAPYVTVSEQIGAGVYRVQPNQRVLFEHGSVRDVVDNEPQPCGCPAAVSVANAGTPAKKKDSVATPGSSVAKQSPAVGGPSSTPDDTAFPLAQSEGLAPMPPVKPSPSMPGVTQAQVTTTLSYNAPIQAVPTGAPDGMATPESAATTATAPAPGFGLRVNPSPVTLAQTPEPAALVNARPPKKPGLFRKLGHLLARLFG
jgi:hypothetical protein